MRLLVATRSAGKMREIRRILADVPDLEVLSLDDVGIEPDPAEDDLEPFDTFEENARSKARYFHERSGLPTVADDSGIEVDALGGAPGVRSKRFALDALAARSASSGEGSGAAASLPDPAAEPSGQALDDANNRHLVERLAGVAPQQRTARYVCVAVLVDGDAPPLCVRGEAEGLIVDRPRGNGGFGYDPHVLVPELGRTFAELDPAEKDLHSHRGDAFRALARLLRRR